MSNDIEFQIREMARLHYESDDTLTEIYVIEDPRENPKERKSIRLLEISTCTVPVGVMPLAFPVLPGDRFSFPSVLVQITPEEFDELKRGALHLPDGLQVGELIPPPQIATKAG